MKTAPRVAILTAAIAMAFGLAACGGGGGGNNNNASVDQPPPPDLAKQGQAIFRFDTFGDETKFTDQLRLNEPVGSAVDPTTALAVGLKVDADNPTGAPQLYERVGFVIDRRYTIWSKAL